MYKQNEDSDEDEYWPVRAGEVGRDTVEHIETYLRLIHFH